MFTLLNSTQDITVPLKATQVITSVPGKMQVVKHTEGCQEDLILQVFRATEDLICVKVLNKETTCHIVNVLELKRAVGVDAHSLVTFDLINNNVILSNCTRHSQGFETPVNLGYAQSGQEHLIPEPVELESYEGNRIKELFDTNQGIVADPEKIDFINEIKEAGYLPVAIFVS